VVIDKKSASHLKSSSSFLFLFLSPVIAYFNYALVGPFDSDGAAMMSIFVLYYVVYMDYLMGDFCCDVTDRKCRFAEFSVSGGNWNSR